MSVLKIKNSQGVFEEITTIKGETGEGVAEGGITGQVLAKKSNTDYDTEWIDVQSGGGNIDDVKVNGTSVVTNKVANVTVPTELKDLSEDSTHKVVTEAEKTTWNNKGTYSKPAGGIPKTDLASDVQASLDKADIAVVLYNISSSILDLTSESTSAEIIEALGGDKIDEIIEAIEDNKEINIVEQDEFFIKTTLCIINSNTSSEKSVSLMYKIYDGSTVNISYITINKELNQYSFEKNEEVLVTDNNYVHTDNNYTTSEKTKLANLNIIQYSTMPTADSSNVNKIVEYVGETDTFTNGYFYKNINTEVQESIIASQTDNGVTLGTITVDNNTFKSQVSAGTHEFVIRGYDTVLNFTNISVFPPVSIQVTRDNTFDKQPMIPNAPKMYSWVDGSNNFYVTNTLNPNAQTKLYSYDISTEETTDTGTTFISSNTPSQIEGRWTKKEGDIYTDVDISDYGISLISAGFPGNTITVVYTPYSNTYAWTQINVQPDTDISSKVNISDIINDTAHTDTNKPLSANIGKELQDEIDNLKARGRFLALWNSATGLAMSNPQTSPYTYTTGDYFIVGTVDATTNYKPDGSTYTTGTASTTVETNSVAVDDVYYYDGTNWRLQVNTQKTISFTNIAGQPSDNSNLASALNAKVDIVSGKGLSTNDYTTADKNKLDGIDMTTKENVSNKVTSINSSSTDTQYPSAKCVYDKLQPVIATTLPTPVGSTSTLEIGTEYYLGSISALDIAFPTGTATGQYCYLQFTAGSAFTPTISKTNTNNFSITITSGKIYELLATWNGTKWVVIVGESEA